MKSGPPLKRISLMAAAATVLATTGLANSALACRYLVPRAEQLATYEGRVLATVTSAERVENPGWNTWTVHAASISPSEAVQGPAEFTFSVTLSSDGCGQTPLPPAGEVWVLYFTKIGSSQVARAFPLDYLAMHQVPLPDLQ